MAEDAQAGGGTTINFPGPPAFEQRRTTPGMERTVATPGEATTVEGPKVEMGVLAPAQQANLDQSDQLAAAQADTAERQRKQQAAADDIQAEHDMQAQQLQGQIAEEKKFRDEQVSQSISTWQNRLEGAYNAAKTQPAPSLFADGSTGHNLIRAAGLALAGLGDTISAGAAARYGGQRTNSVGEIIESDLQRQREKIAKLKDDVVMARTGVKDAEDARKLMLSEVDAKGAGFLSRLEAMTKARMSALKAGDQGQIAAQNLLADIQTKKLEFQQRSLAPLTEKHTLASTTTKTEAPSVTEKRQGTTVENTTRETSPTAKPVNDVVMGDPLNPQEAGKPLGEVSSGRGGAQAFSQQDTGLTTAADALKALQADIKENGERPVLPADIKRRNALRNNATLQVGAVSTAGQSEMALSTEAGTIGAIHNPIAQWVAGDNPEAIARKIHELETRKVRGRGQGLLPMSPEASASLQARQANAPAVPKNAIPPIVPPSAAAPANSIPPVTPTTQSPRAQYVDLLKRNPGLRRTTQGRKAMGTYNITEADLGR